MPFEDTGCFFDHIGPTAEAQKFRHSLSQAESFCPRASTVSSITSSSFTASRSRLLPSSKSFSHSLQYRVLFHHLYPMYIIQNKGSSMYASTKFPAVKGLNVVQP